MQVNEQLSEYIQEQMANADFQLKAYVYNQEEQKNPIRDTFYQLSEYLENFLQGDNNRIFILSGLRGSGKTTLLAQLYHHVICGQDYDKLFLSVDDIKKLMDSSLNEALREYQKITSNRFEKLTRPLILFLDEIQYDEKWAITLKSIFDKSPNVFIFATGSSALKLQEEIDLSRRAVFVDIDPLKFNEYLEIKHSIKIETSLIERLNFIIYESESASQAYKELNKIQSQIELELSKFDILEINKYLKYGTLPFVLRSKNEALIYEEVKKLVNRIVNLDIKDTAKFSADTLNKIPQLIYALADTDNVALDNLSKSLQISRPTLNEILDVLEKSDLLTRIYPYGSHLKQVRRSSKYLFSAAIIRAMYFSYIHNTRKTFLGKVLEDVAVLYFKNFLAKKINTSLTYDKKKDCADFILSWAGSDNLIIEVGLGDKDFKQTANSLKHIKAKYAINISNSELKLSKDQSILSLPLKYFLLT